MKDSVESRPRSQYSVKRNPFRKGPVRRVSWESTGRGLGERKAGKLWDRQANDLEFLKEPIQSSPILSHCEGV